MSMTFKVKQKLQTTTSKMSKLAKLAQIKNRHLPRWVVFSVTFIATFGMIVTPVLVQADRFSNQIRELKNENAALENQSDALQVEADGIQGTINALQTQINGLQAQINESQAQIADTEQKIVEAQAELDRQRDLLGQNIKAMYLEGDMSTLEMLASSKDLSEYLDKQQYRDSVKDKIKETLDKVTALKLQLKSEKERLEAQKKDQETRQALVAQQRAEQNRLLGLNQAQRSALDSEIRNNNTQIAELRRQQAIENARFLGAPGSGVACGGGYPGSTRGPFGNWGCNHAMDNTIDNWGMYNRQCVSYTAYKVAASGRHMPYWGGRGNANRWDDNARAAGIPVDDKPRPGDVAVSNAGYYGHTMYVEHVYDDGRILISQYNGDWTGKYSEAVIRPSGLVFIHFP